MNNLMPSLKDLYNERVHPAGQRTFAKQVFKQWHYDRFLLTLGLDTLHMPMKTISFFNFLCSRQFNS